MTHSNDPIQGGTGQVLVLAVDFTDASHEAVAVALRNARPGDQLHLVHAVPEPIGTERARLEARANRLEHDPDLVRAFLDEACEVKHVRARVPIDVHARIGDPVEAICQMAVDVEADAIICGTHARHGLKRLIEGSVAERLVREAPCSVIVAKPMTYRGARKSDMPEAPCGECAAIRAETGDMNAWCSVHGRDHDRRHTYGPADSRANHPASFNIHV